MTSTPSTTELSQNACSGKLRRKMAHSDNPLSAISVGNRLELLRAALDLQDKTLAGMIHASPQKWGNWKAGRNVIPHDFAAKLCAVTGATTDFIYRDVRANMAEGLAEKIAKVESSLNLAQPKPSRRA
jgi:transcriptional regulator with XRE-family HTH domain